MEERAEIKTLTSKMICFMLCVLLLPSFSFGRVTIIYPYYPVYVQTGKELTLICNSSQRYDLQWEWKTDSSGQTKEVIETLPGGPFSIRTVSEEPSGYVESTLTKRDLKVLDTGNYICMDKGDESTYTVYVTVLHIITTDVTAEEGEEEVTLQCKIIGFTNNIPQMAVTWSMEDMLIATESGKYVIDVDDQRGVTTLTIINPAKEDGGTYGCVFALSTFFGQNFFAMETVRLNADKLPATVSGGTDPHLLSSPVTLLPLLLSLLVAIILT